MCLCKHITNRERAHSARGHGQTRTGSNLDHIRGLPPGGVNYCARSVVTCDSHLAADEIMVPHSVTSRLTYPLVVLQYNVDDLTERMAQGQVLFLQRAAVAAQSSRLRAIAHIAVQTYTPGPGDRLLRRGRKYPMTAAPTPQPEDVALPVQCAGSEGIILCFGDRILREGIAAALDPLLSVSWPVLQPGDTVLVTPRDGDWCLINRQPTLVRLGV
jgi:DNA-directed RNA polymerase beta' subunit